MARTNRLVRWILLGVVAVGNFAAPAWAKEPPDLRASVSAASPSTDGTFELVWGDPASHGRAGLEYHVQLAAPPDASSYQDWYRGPAQQSFVSGIPTGEARARVRARKAGDPWGVWSEPLPIPVRHHAMTKALGFMALGLTVFSVIASYVLVMARRTLDERSESRG